MSLIIRCLKCKETFPAEEEMLGKEMNCPLCNEKIHIPDKTKSCEFCGEEILRIAQKCKHCGEFTENITNKNPIQSSKEELEWFWYLLIWGGLIIPCAGPGIIVVVSSIMYYIWKKEYPNKANKINKLGWIVFGVGILFWFFIIAIIALFS